MTDIPKWAAERAVELVDQEAPPQIYGSSRVGRLSK